MFHPSTEKKASASAGTVCLKIHDVYTWKVLNANFKRAENVECKRMFADEYGILFSTYLKNRKTILDALEKI